MRRSTVPILAIASLLGCTTAPTLGLADGGRPVTTFIVPSAVEAGTYQLPAPVFPPATSVGVRLTNTGSTPVVVEHGACSVAVWLYRTDRATRTPAWQNMSENTACVMIAYTHSIAPHAFYDLGGAVLAAATRGDSLPVGPYLVRVAIRRLESPNGSERLVVLDAGQVTLP